MLIKQVVKNKKAASATEYMVLLGLLAIVALGAVLTLGGQLSVNYRNADRSLELYNETVASANAQNGAPTYDTGSEEVGPGLYEKDPLILAVDTQHVAGNTIGIPLAVGAGNGVDVRIDWGDGTIEFYSEPGMVTHDYASAGEYTVRISGNLAHYGEVYGTGSSLSTYNQAIEQVVDFGDTGLVSLEMAFSNAENLTSLAALPPTVGDMSFAFSNIDGALPDVTGLDVSNVEEFNGMFAFAPAFNQDISGWLTNSAIDMSVMFYDASSFNQPIGGWETGNVVSMYGMFNGASVFDQPIGGWDVSSVSNMSYMFQGASAFNQPLNSWTTTNLVAVAYMFNEATSFNQDLDNWDVSGVSSFMLMFKDAHAFNGDVSTWQVGTATVFQGMFNTALSFNGDLSNWDMSSAFNIAFMFDKAEAFAGDLSSWDVGTSCIPPVHSGVPFCSIAISRAGTPRALFKRVACSGIRSRSINRLEHGMFPMFGISAVCLEVREGSTRIFLGGIRPRRSRWTRCSKAVSSTRIFRRGISAVCRTSRISQREGLFQRPITTVC